MYAPVPSSPKVECIVTLSLGYYLFPSVFGGNTYGSFYFLLHLYSHIHSHRERWDREKYITTQHNKLPSNDAPQVQ